jgi:hypothetical protein
MQSDLVSEVKRILPPDGISASSHTGGRTTFFRRFGSRQSFGEFSSNHARPFKTRRLSGNLIHFIGAMQMSFVVRSHFGFPKPALSARRYPRP